LTDRDIEDLQATFVSTHVHREADQSQRDRAARLRDPDAAISNEVHDPRLLRS